MRNLCIITDYHMSTQVRVEIYLTAFSNRTKIRGTINNLEVFMDNNNVTWATGWNLFAGIVMLVYSLVLIIAGLAGIFNGDEYFRSDSGQLLILNFVSWGWIHLVLGLGMATSAIGLLANNEWARVGAVLLIMAAILLNVLVIGAYPGWALTFLIFDALLLVSLLLPGNKDAT